jgi:hypothetical protein
MATIIAFSTAGRLSAIFVDISCNVNRLQLSRTSLLGFSRCYLRDAFYMIFKYFLDVGAQGPPIFLRKLFKLGLQGRSDPQIHLSRASHCRWPDLVMW